MRIESYEFGRITVDGETHTADVIVHAEGVEGSWWRKEGHRLHIEDLTSVWDRRPERLVVGTGAYGRMVVPAETVAHARSLGIALEARPTAEAVALFNDLEAKRQTTVAAAFHLTC